MMATIFGRIVGGKRLTSRHAACHLSPLRKRQLPCPAAFSFAVELRFSKSGGTLILCIS
jgi:hypothetical protein